MERNNLTETRSLERQIEIPVRAQVGLFGLDRIGSDQLG